MPGVDPAKMLGLDIGDAHVVRNAGGRASDDAIRSFTISSWLLGTREFAVIHHTDCGMTMFTDDVLRDKIRDEKRIDVGATDYSTFQDLDGSVRDDVDGYERRVASGRRRRSRGYVYDVRTGRIREVVPAS